MRFGVVILPQLPWREAAARWRAVEEMGFDHGWTYDHLSWRDLADEPWFATIPTLTAAATVTHRIGLGTWVASPNFRHPVPFAKELMTVDDISDGRLIVGLGSGGVGWDADVLGEPRPSPRERVDRFDAFTTMLDTLLTQPVTTVEHPPYAAVQARMRPGPTRSPRPPLVVAANGPRAVRLAVRLAGLVGDGWATTGVTDPAEGRDAWWAGLREVVARVDDALAAAGREPASLDRYLNLDSGADYSLSSAGLFAQMVGQAAELGFTDVIAHWPRPSRHFIGAESVLHEVAAALPDLR